MKVSRVLSSVLFEPWMLLPSAAEAYLPVVANWLLGKDVQFEEKPKLGLEMAYAGRIFPGYPEDIADMPMGSVAIVGLKGELTKYDGMCSYGSQSIANLMKLAALSKNITGLVLDVDGPGGSVNAIAPLLESIGFVKSQGKPVVVHGDMVASAHLYAAVHGDSFLLDNAISSQAGSIGTMIQFADYSAYWEKEGIKLHKIYATQSTHKNEEFEQALEDNYLPMRSNLLDPLAERFREAVKKARKGKLDEGAEGILSGAMFFGDDAVKHGLADGIGTLGDAVQRVLDLAEINKFMSL